MLASDAIYYDRDPFNTIICQNCSGIGKTVFMECAGMTTSGAMFVCNECEDYQELECGTCETCKFWHYCEWRIVPVKPPRITAHANYSEFFGRFLHYHVRYGARYERYSTLKEAVKAANRMTEGVRR